MSLEQHYRTQLDKIDATIAEVTSNPNATDRAQVLDDLAGSRALVVAELEKFGAVLDGFPTTRQAHPKPAGDDAAVFGPEARDGVTAYARAHQPAAFENEQELSFGRYLRAFVLGDWSDAPAEHRFLSEAGTGVNLVPTPLAASIIDRARNQTRVIQAGSRTVPMDAQTLKIARVLTDPTPAWRTENNPIAETDGTLDSVTFTARSLSFHIKISRELIEDSAPSVESVLRNQVASVVALELDRVALRGTGSAPEPRGVLNQSGVTLLAHGTNGSTIGSPPSAGVMGWEFLVDAAATVRNNNFQPGAQIMAPRTDQKLGLLRDTTNQYIAPPAYLNDLPRLSTKQVPINLTVGSSSDCSEVYSGQWDHLMIGMRTTLQISLLDQPFMVSAGQLALVAWLRADVQLAQPAAFAVDTGVRS